MRDVRVLSPSLPLATRLRLGIEQRITGLGGWLASHGQPRAAELLWRACQMW